MGGGGGGEARPSKLTNSGSAFSIAYSAGSDNGGNGGPLAATDLRSAELAR